MSNITALPLISEKAVELAEQNTYVFEVPKNANKIEISLAVASQFNVGVESVNTTRVRGKPKSMRTRRRIISGQRRDFKKAYVTLKEGDSIKLFEGGS